MRILWAGYNATSGESRPSCGDVDGDGYDEIVVGLAEAGAGYLEIFDHASAEYAHLTWGRVSWAVYNSDNGESRPACGDIDGDGADEIIVGLGPYPAAGGWFEIFDFASGSLSHKAWKRLNWTGYNRENGETRPTCADLDRDGYDEIIVGLGPTGGGYLEIFDDASADYRHVAWPRIRWDKYSCANGETWPGVKR